MAPKASSPVPTIYRLFFTYMDPLMCISGAYLSFFEPESILATTFPRTHNWAQVTPSHAVLLDQAGGAYVMMAFLMITMLRYTNDLNIWKIFQFSILMTDFALYYAFWKGLKAQGRLGLESLRWEEWGTLGLVGSGTVLRTLFLLRVGVAKNIKRTKKRS
ncbi:hypothetical protein CC80DRAFT_491269 [Byssothecium circinans]|uniref:DUF7704 domain-containing protein n=1 Tax=Byssothecium circinans TaxID=147558 RepID=A0A6A5U4N0_9PLEO|nr:hypothetical protein CC80DRAFT_491269 [Byssothecium circinans]